MTPAPRRGFSFVDPSAVGAIDRGSATHDPFGLAVM